MSSSWKRHRIAMLALAIGLAIAGYFAYWLGRLHDYRSQISAVLGQATPPLAIKGGALSYGGFPYRLQGNLRDGTLERIRPDYRITLKGASLEANQQPWRSDLTIAAIDRPSLELVSKAVSGGLTMSVKAARARASISTNARGVERLSLVFEDGEMQLSPWLGETKVRFDQLEIHGRETAALKRQRGDKSPTGPVFLEFFLRGEGVAFGKGAQPLTLMASLGVTGDPKVKPGAPIVEPWRQKGGTVELYTVQMMQGKDALVSAKATLALNSTRRLIGAGTLNSPCPQQALTLVGLPVEDAPAGRHVHPIALPLRLEDGALVLDARQLPISGAPDRNPALPCPALRR